MKKTKIIATIGPASKDEETLKEMILSGMDIARINMKHATHQFAENVIKKINKINDELDTNVSIMLDIEGPDITVGKFIGGTAYLTENTKIRIYNEEIMGDSTKFSVNCENFVAKIKVRVLRITVEIILALIAYQNALLTLSLSPAPQLNPTTG